jgi:hypothetical protein
MSTKQQNDVLGETVVSFSRDGLFPYEDEVSAMDVGGSALPSALVALTTAKSELEVGLQFFGFFIPHPRSPSVEKRTTLF